MDRDFTFKVVALSGIEVGGEDYSPGATVTDSHHRRTYQACVEGAMNEAQCIANGSGSEVKVILYQGYPKRVTIDSFKVMPAVGAVPGLLIRKESMAEIQEEEHDGEGASAAETALLELANAITGLAESLERFCTQQVQSNERLITAINRLSGRM